MSGQPSVSVKICGLSTTEAGITRLTYTDVAQCDWLPGTVAQVYGLPPGARGRDHLASIAVRDHVARLAQVHPSAVRFDDATNTAQAAGRTYHVRIGESPDMVTVSERSAS